MKTHTLSQKVKFVDDSYSCCQELEFQTVPCVNW